jgi:hypothetical protein
VLNTQDAVTTEYLVRLVYELLDAHGDTIDLARPVVGADPDWAAHLNYLQGLQRVGRETLARVV